MPTEADHAFYARCQEGLQALYAGQWVLIYQGQLVGAYDTQVAALVAASGRLPCLIRQMDPETPPAARPAWFSE